MGSKAEPDIPELRVDGGSQNDTKKKQVELEENQERECSESQENKECKKEATDQLAESY